MKFYLKKNSKLECIYLFLSESNKTKLELNDYLNDNDDNLASNFQMQNLNKNEEKFANYAKSAINCNSSSNQIGIVSFQEKSKIITSSQSSDPSDN